MNQIRLNQRYEIVDYLSLKSQGDLCIFSPVTGIDATEIKKCPVLGQMNPLVRDIASDGLDGL
jgi:hypothetical protein